MSNATVIDQLIVKLGLDPKDFKKGQAQVKQSLRETGEEQKKVGAKMGASLDSVIARYAKLATVVVAAKKVINFTSEMSVNIRQLGVDARNLGIAADELRNFQNVAEMMGGTADGVTSSVKGLQKSIYDLAYNGQVSDSLVTLGRLGVQFQDTAGEARDFKAIVLDTQTAIQEAMGNGMSRRNANNMLAQAGFDPGLSRAMLDGTVGSQLSRQEQRRQVSKEIVGAAERWEQSATNRSQSTDAMMLRPFEEAAQAGTFINDKAAGLADYANDATVGGLMKSAGQSLDVAGDKLLEAGKDIQKWFVDMGAKASAQSGKPLGMRLNNPGNLREPGGVRFQSFRTMEEGILKANWQLDRYAARGLDTIDEIVNTYAPESDGNNVEAYKRHLETYVGKKRGEVLGGGDRALLMAGMFRHEQGAKAGAPDSGEVATVLQMAEPTLGGARAGGSSVTNIDIGEVTVNTRATDANGIARDFDGALRRKAMSAHAERGQQ